MTSDQQPTVHRKWTRGRPVTLRVRRDFGTHWMKKECAARNKKQIQILVYQCEKSPMNSFMFHSFSFSDSTPNANFRRSGIVSVPHSLLYLGAQNKRHNEKLDN